MTSFVHLAAAGVAVKANLKTSLNNLIICFLQNHKSCRTD